MRPGHPCNPNWHIRPIVGLHLTMYSIHSTDTDRRWATSHSNTPQVKNGTTGYTVSSLRRVTAVEHHTAEQYSKPGRTKPRKRLPRKNRSWHTSTVFLKIQCLWEAALEIKRACFSKVILESNATPNISRSDSFSTIPPVTGGDWR